MVVVENDLGATALPVIFFRHCQSYSASKL